MTYEEKLEWTAKVFEAICQAGEDGGSFRYLIYNLLGFEPDAYTPLYLAGGMNITNEFDLTDSPANRIKHELEDAAMTMSNKRIEVRQGDMSLEEFFEFRDKLQKYLEGAIGGVLKLELEKIFVEP